MSAFQDTELAQDAARNWVDLDDHALPREARLLRGREALVHLERTLAAIEMDPDNDPVLPWDLYGALIDFTLLDEGLARQVQESAAFSRLRKQLRGTPFVEYAANLDQALVSGLANLNRFEEAEDELQNSLAVYRSEPTCHAMLLATLADVLRLQERWGPTRLALDQADSILAALDPVEPSFLGFEALCRSLGVRAQVEMFLGRLEHASRASRAERAAAQRYHAAFPDLAIDALAGARYRALDLLMSMGRYESVVAEVNRADEGEAHSAELHLFRGLAKAGLELRDHVQTGVARRELEMLIDGDAIQGLDRWNAAFGLARLARERGDLEALQKHIEQADQASLEWTMGAEIPPRERASLNALKAAHARLRGASEIELKLRLLDVEQALIELRATWQAVPRLIGGVGYLHDGMRREILGECIELCMAIGQPERALRQVMAMQAQGAVSRRRGASVPEWDELQRDLIGDGGALVYLPTLAGTHLLVVDQGGVTHCRLGRERELRQLVDGVKFDSLAGNTTGEGLLRLSDELLPVSIHQRVSGWQHVYVAGASLLGNPPFEKLPFGASYFGNELALGFVSSLPLAVMAAQSTQAIEPWGPGAVRLLAGPVSSNEVLDRWPNLVSLDLGPAAWERLVSGFGGTRSETVDAFVGSSVSRSALLSDERGQVRVLQVFAHGVFAEERDVPAGIVLSSEAGGDGLIWADDLQDMRAPELVVLATCGGARGPERFGEDGVEHLGGAFLSAGASCVLLARDDLDAGATLELLEVFFRGVSQGESPMEALRLARCELSDSGGGLAAPAALFLLGAAHRPMTPRLTKLKPGRSMGPLTWLFGITMAVATFLVAMRRPRLRS